jgi:hypothetical protein
MHYLVFLKNLNTFHFPKVGMHIYLKNLNCECSGTLLNVPFHSIVHFYSSRLIIIQSHLKLCEIIHNHS